MQSRPWIYLSKKGTDEYINMFARGAGQTPTPIEIWDYDQDVTCGIVLRGIMKHKIMKRCWQDGRPFRYMDTGYFGNRPNPRNPSGWKWYHRIVENDLQHGDIIPRPADRWQQLGMKFAEQQRSGSDILIVMPDDKACQFYDTTPQAWLSQVQESLMSHTDRKIIVRHRVADPNLRTRNSATSLAAQLKQNIFAVVTFNSTAAIESLLNGIPVFVIGAANAARPVANTDLAKIETAWYPDKDLLHDWACHLAYGQFHIDELANGRALAILEGNA